MHALADRIRSKEFTGFRKGYDAAEVAAFLDRVADDVTEPEAELRREGVRANALERRVQTPLQAEGNVEAAFLAAAQRESSDIRATLKAEHVELVEKVRSLQSAVIGMIEHGATSSPALAAVLDAQDAESEAEAAS